MSPDDLTIRFLEHVRPLWRRLHLTARRYAAGGQEAEDLVQETLLRAWKGFLPTDETSYSRAWFFVIMRNVVLEWSRTARRRVRLVALSDAELTGLSAFEPTEPFAPLPAMDERRFRDLLDDRLVSALDALDPVFREVIVLSVAAGLSYREVGQVLQCPVGTVMSRMARARRRLRELLSQEVGARGWLREGRP